MKKLLFLFLVLLTFSSSAQSISWFNELLLTYYEQGKYDEAIAIGEYLVPRAKKELGETHREYTIILNSLAILYEIKNRHAEAEALYKDVLQIYETSSGTQHPEYAQSLGNLALLYQKMAEYQRADSLYQQALQIIETTLGNHHVSYATILNSRAGLYHLIGRFKEAEKLYKQALKIVGYTLGMQHEYYAASLNNLAYLYNEMDLHHEAKPLFKQALHIFKNKSGDQHPDYATGLNNLADMYKHLGQYTKAENLYKQASEIRRKSFGDQHPQYATSLNNLAVLYKQMGRYKEAETIIKRALVIFKTQLGDQHPDYAGGLSNLAGLYEDMGLYKKAEFLYNETLDILKPRLKGQHLWYANTLNSLATLYQSLGRYTEAENRYKKALEIMESQLSKKHSSYALILNNLAMFYELIGDNNKAENLINEAIQIYEAIFGNQHPNYALSLNNLASIYTSTERYEKAKTLYEEVIQIRKSQLGEKHPDYAKSLNDLAFLYMYINRNQEAEEFYLQSIQIIKDQLGEKHPGYANGVHNLALLYTSLGRYEKAESLFETSLDLSRSLMLHYSKGESENNQQNYLEAFKHDFETFFSFLKASHSVQSALAYSTRLFSKGLLLNTKKTIRETITNTEDTELIELWRQYQTQQKSLSVWFKFPKETLINLGINLEVEKQKADDLEKELSHLSGFDLSEKDLSWQQVQRKLAPGDAAVEIVRFRWFNKIWTDTIHYAALIIRPGMEQPRIVYLENGNDLEGKWYNTYLKSRFVEKGSLPKADSLYSHYWETIQKELDGVKRVYLSMDGIYNQINPDILYVHEKEVYLSDVLEIVLLTSTRDLVKKSDKSKRIPNAPVLVGGVDYDGNQKTALQKWNYLPFSLNAIKEIETLIKSHGERPKVIMANEATKNNILELKNPGVLHLATHGYFKGSDYDNVQDSRFRDYYAKKNQVSNLALDPMLRSGLVLAGANILSDNGGLLTAYEIINQMDLRDTELVVLSACDTAKGGNQYGEGVYGLQRAFQVVGAQSLIMSLWHVHDQMAKEFFINFYTNWLLKGMDKRSAFNVARNMIRKKDWKAPGQWGAFIFVGL